MRISEYEQGTPEWLLERIGKISASRVSDVITATGKPSASAGKYLDSIIAEMLMGEPIETFISSAMQRGTELEPEARAWYELQADADVEEVGFCIHDELDCGASPDGLVGTDRGLEIKCPQPNTHVGYLRGGKAPTAYIPQMQMCMWITDREHWDFVSYHPLMPKLLVTVDRDQKYIDAMELEVRKGLDYIANTIEQIRSKYA